MQIAQHNHDSQRPVMLVTGSAKRIGAEIIRQAHAHGYNVIIHCHHSYEQALTLANQLNHIRPQSAHILQADLDIVNNSHDLNEFVTQALACFGRLDALINNASRFYATPITDITDNHQHFQKSWQELFLTNAKAPLALSMAFLPYLRQTQGSIINLLDIHANGRPFKNYSLYNMAKSAGQMMVQSLALEFAPDVRVNGVAPGANIFPEHDTDQAIDVSLRHAIEQSIPMNRVGTPADVAGAVLYLVEAEYITGHIISIDGGRGLTLAGG